MFDLDADRHNCGVVSIISTRMSNFLHIEHSLGKSLPKNFDGWRQHRVAELAGGTSRIKPLPGKCFGGSPVAGKDGLLDTRLTTHLSPPALVILGRKTPLPSPRPTRH